MADDVVLNAGSGGDTVAADDIGGVKYQRVKLSLGADGSATDTLGGAGAAAAGVQRVVLATDTTVPNVTGNIADGTADAGNSVKTGLKAVAHGSNPTGVDAADRVSTIGNVAGVPFVIGGHPNIITAEYLWTTAQTDDAIVTVGSGVKIVVTQLQVTIDEATTVGVGFRLGFGATTLPSAPTDGTAVAGYLASHRGLVPGTGLIRGDGSGILGVGADGEDLRITTEATTSGSGSAVISYYTIEV